MIRRKPKTTTPIASEQAITPSPISGFPPPIAYQFKPGQSGNPGGRPKIIHTAYAAVLAKKVKVKDEETGEETEKTGAELLAQSMFETANSSHRNNVAAAKELRGVVEPTDEEQSAGNAASVSALTRVFMELMLVRKEKMANVVERS